MTSIAWADAPRAGPVSPLWTSILLSSLLFLPGVLGFFFEDFSFATGTAIVCAGALALVMAGQVPLTALDAQGALVASAAVSFIVAAHLLISYAVTADPDFDLMRAFFSLLLFGLILLVVPVICKAVLQSDVALLSVVRGLCIVFALSAIMSLLKIQPPTPSLGEKPTFPFTEPSFLGFSMPAVLIFTLLRSSLPIRMVIITVFLGLGYGLSNFTIIATCLLAAIVSLPLSWIAAGAIALTIAASSLDLSYYLDRLDFDWANSTNLSSLVYVQGWQMLQEALHTTHGWGLGFQQLGIGYTNVPASIRINAIMGRDVNLQDGGFILSKIGSEFGLIGIGLVLVCLWVAARSALTIRARGRVAEMSDGELFARSCVIGYTIEILLRGTNYFTGTLVLLLASLLYLHRMGPRTATVLT